MRASSFLKFSIQNCEAEPAGQRVCPHYFKLRLGRGRWVYEKAEKEAGWEQRAVAMVLSRQLRSA
jgi:hypothetical protein